QDALLKWTGNEITYHDYIKDNWNSGILNGSSWNQAVHDGFFKASSPISNVETENAASEASAEQIQENVPTTGVEVSDAMLSTLASNSSSSLQLLLYPKVGMGNGHQANNPWLQEFPDPITRVSWDNYITISKSDAEALGLENDHAANGGLNGSYVKVETADGQSLVAPVIIQPGQANGSVGLSFGYGRKKGLKEEMQTGVNAYKLYSNFRDVQTVKLEKVSGIHEFACVQLHNTLMGRGDIVKETTLRVFNTKDASEWNPMPHVSINHQNVPVTSPSADLWEGFDHSIGHHFNLSIDLNACTGCGACVIACHAENNVPVVGKAEVRKSRDMHWL